MFEAGRFHEVERGLLVDKAALKLRDLLPVDMAKHCRGAGGAAMARHGGGGHHRHSQGLGFANAAQDDDEDPEGSPAMKRRRRAAIFDVLPLLQDLDAIQRRISRQRWLRFALLLLVAAFLLVLWRCYSGSGDGGPEIGVSQAAKVVKASNLNRLDMPMRTLAGVRQGAGANVLFPCFYRFGMQFHFAK